MKSMVEDIILRYRTVNSPPPKSYWCRVGEMLAVDWGRGRGLWK